MYTITVKTDDQIKTFNFKGVMAELIEVLDDFLMCGCIVTIKKD
jgi:hypothetical protein